MILIILKSGECIEVMDATWVDTVNGSLACRDDLGNEIARFQAAEVEAFTASDHVAQILEEEVCEDEVRTIPAGSENGEHAT